MLNDITININDLLLDPNNPRFKSDLKETDHIQDEKLEGMQGNTLKCFKIADASSEEDVTDISDLYDSIKTIGFIPIDRIVVRTINNSTKYLVIEGNRRISAVKNILSDYENQRRKFSKQKERVKFDPLKGSCENISCLLLETKGLHNDEIAQKISIILGLRHHGSLLEWDALPKAYNIYKEYMCIEPVTASFEFIASKRNEVHSRLSIPKGKVTSALKTYVAYLQLCDIYSVKDRHYSLIAMGVNNKTLSTTYFKIDDSTYQFDEPSLEKMNQICQFSNRDNPELKKKILDNPKTFNRFGILLKKRDQAKREAVKEHADSLIRRILDEDDIEMDVEAAIDDLTDFINRTDWVDTVNKLLGKQEQELDIDKYIGSGNERGNKDTLKIPLEKLRRVMQL